MMVRRPRSARVTADKDAAGPLPYGLLARLMDHWAARRDGNAVIPPLWSADGMTPYMEVRNRHFRDWAEREYQEMLSETAELERERAVIRRRIANASNDAAAILKTLEAMGTTPANLDHRNVIEERLGVDRSLTRVRRMREFARERGKVHQRDLAARRVVSELAAEEAELTELISAQERIFHARVRQLLQHSLRRCATYMRHIVHYHPDGTAVIPCLQLALPSEPDWLRTGTPAGPAVTGTQPGANGASHHQGDSLVEGEVHDAQL
jgi:hypothetical protein